jgi:hypothetical protein
MVIQGYKRAARDEEDPEMTNARKARAARKAVAMTPQRAMTGPYVGPAGLRGAGTTNDDALQAIVESLGGRPVRGDLYRITMAQGPEGHEVFFIGEYLGLAEDRALDQAGQAEVVETVLQIAIRNPVLPLGAYGTSEKPLILWPLDIVDMSPAQAGDLDTPLAYKVEGEKALRLPGRARVQ